jgi:hypothetical protein
MNKKELLQKVKALADRGIDGEKTNAEELLKKLMERYGITEEDISEDKIRDHELKIKDIPMIKRLVGQIMYSVVGNIDNNNKIYEYRRDKKKRMCITCTDSNFIEIAARFEFYQEHWAHDIEIMYNAFVQSNLLFPPLELTKEKELGKMTEDDLKALNLAERLEKHEYLKRIEGGTQ